jgi:DNA-binding CsgD family transcriptional regulator
MDNIAPTFPMGIDDPPPTMLCDGATIAPRPAGSVKLVSDDFPVFHVASPSQAKSIYELMKRKLSKRKAVREDRPSLLSRRESQVVELMGKGLSRAEISDRLGVSRKCVSVFIERARGKFGLKTSLHLRHVAFRLASVAVK